MLVKLNCLHFYRIRVHARVVGKWATTALVAYLRLKVVGYGIFDMHYLGLEP